MRITVFGATGRVGRLVVARALEEGHEVTAFARNPGKLDYLHSERLTIVAGELSDNAAMVRAIRHADAVVSTLGPHGQPNGSQLSDGMRAIVNAMAQQGVRRLIVLSTASVRDPYDRFDAVYGLLVASIKLLFHDAYSEVVRIGDVVRSSDTDWTLVRIGLLNNRGRMPVRAGHYGRGELRLRISAISLAEFILRLASNLSYVRESPAVSN